MEREKIESEYNELIAKIAEYKAILADENKLLGVIKEELTVISEKFGDERRTTITAYTDDITDEELIKRYRDKNKNASIEKNPGINLLYIRYRTEAVRE